MDLVTLWIVSVYTTPFFLFKACEEEQGLNNFQNQFDYNFFPMLPLRFIVQLFLGPQSYVIFNTVLEMSTDINFGMTTT